MKLLTKQQLAEIRQWHKDRGSFHTVEAILDHIGALEAEKAELSDGYHTFKELYDFRRVYNAALFNEWSEKGIFKVHKSTRHHDGEECFGGGYFVVVAVLPAGQITNHYKMKHWEEFKIPAFEKARFEYDGHTAMDTVDRLNELLSKQEQE